MLHQDCLPGNNISSGKYCIYHLSLFASLEEVAIVMKCVNVLYFTSCSLFLLLPLPSLHVFVSLHDSDTVPKGACFASVCYCYYQYAQPIILCKLFFFNLGVIFFSNNEKMDTIFLIQVLR